MRRSAAVKTWVWRPVVLSLLLLSSMRPLSAQVITVTNTADSGPGSLREAIANAQDGYTINFNLISPATILLNSPLTLGPSVTIAGPGASNLAISGGDGVVVFIVNGGASATIFGLTIEHGSSQLGGGIFNAGTLTLTSCVISNNTLGIQYGGGIFNSGTLSLINSTVSGNSVAASGEMVYGGGIYIDQGTVSLTNTTVSNNTAGGSQSSDSWGGGIYNQGILTLTNTTVSNNIALGSVPLPTFPLSSAGSGGGIYSATLDIPTPRVTLTNSAVSNNTADEYGGILSGGFVGLVSSTVSGNHAIYEAGGIETAGYGFGSFINSTISENSCGSAEYPYCGGAGGFNSSGSLGNLIAATILFTTISGNSCYGPSSGSCVGGMLALFNNPNYLKGTILANNQGGNCSSLNFGPFMASSLGYNLSDDATCASTFVQTGDLNSTPAGLDPRGLQDNGGPTQTVALLASSPAVDAIPVNSCIDTTQFPPTPLTTDQRGVYRPQGSGCDIGSYELQQIPVSGICNGIFNGTFQGNLAVASGDICTFVDGAITGNVVQSGGILRLANVTVGGNVQATGGTRLIGPSTTITGDLRIQNVPSGGAQDSICGLKLQGNLQFQNNRVALVIGSPSSCVGSTIGGTLQVSNNTASTIVDGAVVTGTLQVNNNSGATKVDNNSVTSDLQVQNNASVAIFDNTVNGKLQCGGNKAITGGGNTVSGTKQGQCASF
jgi:hypothetical protein